MIAPLSQLIWTEPGSSESGYDQHHNPGMSDQLPVPAPGSTSLPIRPPPGPSPYTAGLLDHGFLLPDHPWVAYRLPVHAAPVSFLPVPLNVSHTTRTASRIHAMTTNCES
ncbi:hypothetical protein L6452_32807 [Arctium lappa]|uniref:Uncharacterized protein n=1 Tax=Arctium lappa TaxID=4217 RepID=A0ACB8Z6H8_ARCLA|nr:hypothetical protein L6452_32807 [Arctium lappa]